ncbi:hypothetical protein FJZ40_00155 [Candidatus Shapirobacteria bacterium]|nr:hypothetical protein [Candidatus Shapirobacteria bacterium]
MPDFKVGVITHYYDKIGVAVLELSDELAAGDTIKISGHGREFTQVVASMQVEHEQIQSAKRGQTVGMKIDQEAKEGDEVYKVTA